MLLNLSITLISLLASSAVSCINIRVKLTYSLASYCRFVLNSHPQQNIEPLYSYIYQNSAIYAKGKQFYLFDLLLFCSLLFFILYLKMTVFSQWLKGRNIWFWIFGWSQFMLFGFTGTSLTTESYQVSLLCFSWWGGRFVMNFWHHLHLLLWCLWGQFAQVVFPSCVLPKTHHAHVSCLSRIFLRKTKRSLGVSVEPYSTSFHKHSGGRIILCYLKWENASDKYFSSNCNKVFKYNLSSLKTFENHVMTFSTNGPEETLLCLPLWRGPYSSVSFIFCRSCASLFSFCTGDEIQL